MTIKGNNLSFTRYNSHSQIEKGKPLESFTRADGYDYLLRENLKGYGVYLVVNPGGRKDEEVTYCNSLFFECDDISKSEQWKRQERLPFPPSLVVETRNSLHTYYRLDDTNKEGWRSLQQRLIQLMESDPSIHNESRLMRLAGFYHQKKGLEPEFIKIVASNDVIYSRSQFDELLPPLDSERWSETREQVDPEVLKQRLEAAKTRREQALISIDGFPLEICLSKDDRALINEGMREGGRNSAGFKLASNLLATEQWLSYAGYRFLGKADQLFQEFCDRCSPSINSREREQIWRSALRSNPSPSLTDEAIENCIKAWQYNQLSESEKQALRAKNKGFGFTKKSNIKAKIKKAVNSLQQKLSPKTDQETKESILEFEGDRGQFWLENLTVESDILDCSFMGSGKSYAVPRIDNPIGRIIYISPNHRNPSIKQIEDDFIDLIPRSQWGFYRDEEGKLREANQFTDSESLEIKPNCIRGDLFKNLNELGYNPYNSLSVEKEASNPICESCPFSQSCAFLEGMYKFEKIKALQAKKLRCDINSLPRGLDYSQDIIIFEEASKAIKPTKIINSDWGKILLELDRARGFLNEELYRALDSFLQEFRPIWDDKSRYGIKHEEILEKAKFLPINLNTIIQELEANQLDLKEIFQEADSIDKSQLSQKELSRFKASIKLASKAFSKEAFKESSENLKKVPPNALIYLLKGLKGEEGIALRICYGELIISLDNRPNLGFLNASKKIFLEACKNSEEIKLITGFSKPIKAVAEKIETPLKNLNITLIKTEGVISKNLSNTGINRIRAINKALADQFGDFPIIGHKSMIERLDIDGYWFRDNRGSNQFEGSPNLLAIGLPNPNVGAIEDEHKCLGIKESFEEYYQGKVNDEILQLAGRQRANRYPETNFNLYIIAPPDTDLKWLKQYGATVKEIDAVEVSPEAGDRFQVAILGIAKAIIESGEKTVAGIAKAMGKTRQAIHKLLREHGLTFDSILKRIERLNCKPALKTPYKDGFTPRTLVDCFRDILNLDSVILATEVVNVIAILGWDEFVRYFLDEYPEALQHKVLGLLWTLLDSEKGEVGNSG